MEIETVQQQQSLQIAEKWKAAETKTTTTTKCRQGWLGELVDDGRQINESINESSSIHYGHN